MADGSPTIATCAPSPSTTFTQSCHETVTTAAMRASALPVPASPRSETDDRVAADVPFELPDGADAWLLALLLGVRSNDVRDYYYRQYRITTGLEHRF
jgi:hypothetical protein